MPTTRQFASMAPTCGNPAPRTVTQDCHTRFEPAIQPSIWRGAQIAGIRPPRASMGKCSGYGLFPALNDCGGREDEHALGRPTGAHTVARGAQFRGSIAPFAIRT